MATLSHVKSRRMYSWWWDSHISPKNSKWLQDNLTDMDSKVKAMIKLIEEDADSFAKRAEMYYKKRPELMKFVEEFYRAYRALAERYDHATVVIRQAHHTMSEAFPNQESSVLVDDTPVNSGSGDDPETPELSTPPRALVEADDPETTEMSTPPRALVEADDLQSKGFELSSSPFDDVPRNGEHTEVPDIVARIKESNPSNNFESSDYPKLRVRKCLSFQGEDGKQQRLRSDEDQQLQVQAMGGADQEGEPEEILNLKKALAEVEAEKEAGLLHYQQTLEKLSKLESEISHAQQDYQKLSERASTAEAEVWRLKEALAKVEVEKDTNLLKYQRSLDKISSLEKIVSQAEASTCELNQRASIAESEARSLRDELEKVTSEKDSALDQYVLSLEKISNLENRLEFAEEAARMLFERSEKAENQIEALEQEISKLSEEKEVADVRYKKCIDTISSLENKLSSACEELLQLRSEVDDGVAKLKGAEEQCLLLERSNQSLQAELESLMLKIDAQDQELTEKQKELGRLWTCIQEEHFRFVEAETAFLTLQQLHAKTQEEIQALALDLQKRVQILKDMEAHNKKMQDEVLKLNEENVTLNELNVSSATSIKSMQDEISLLKETNRNLQEEVELRLDERNALQRELYCLKEEQNNLNNNHLSILEQVHAIGLSPECLKSSVKKLQDENMNLKQSCERERIEKEALLQKLEIFGRLLEKNSVLENSLSDLSAKLEAAKGKIRALEESCQSLLQEKSNLLDEKTYLGSQLRAANENLGKLSENNTILEKSLSDAHDELNILQTKLKSLEDSCLQLANQKAGLACENDMLGKQLQSTRLLLEEMERQSAELEGRYVIAEKEKASALSRIEELQVALNEEKQEHAHFAEVNETRLAAIESMMHLLQDEYQARKREFEVELDRALHSEIEIFVLKRCALDLEKTNLDVLMKYQNLIEASTLSENVISELQKENVDQQKELKSLSHQASTLRKGELQLLKSLDIGERDACQENDDQDVHLHSILHKIEDTKRSFDITGEENQKLVLEKTVLITLLEQLILEYEHLETEKICIARELKIQSECSSMVKGEALRFQEMNEELKLKLRERDYRVEALVKEVDNLQRNLMDVQGSLHELERENLKIVEEKRFLTEESLLMKDNNNILEEENHIIMQEMLSLGCLSLILENYVDDRTIELKELNEYLGELHGENGAIREKLDSTRNKLGEVEVENISLREKLQKAKDELQNTTAIREKLRNDILLTRDLLHEKQAKAKIQEEVLQNELQKQINEVEIWETEAAVILSQLQTSSVFQVIYEQKVHELMEACNRLEHENIVKDADIKLRSEIISNLTSENESLNVQLAAYDPAITALRECITSLESKTLHRKLQKPMSEEFQGDEMTNDDGLMVADASSASHDLLNRVKAIEKTVVEMEQQLVLHENLDVHSQLKAALSQIEELKYENSLYSRKLRPESEIFEAENALMTKDIMLDQASESSSYAVSRREQFELWEIADQDDSIGLTVGSLKKMVTPSPEKNNDLGQVKSLKKKKLDFPASDALLEKDLSVDKLEISQRSVGSVREGNGQKVLQRLNSDIQKLTNLHITVQDLKMKVENTEKSRKVKAIDEFDTLKQQLEEAEATILKLLNLNGKLMKRIEDNSSDMKSSMDSEDSETVRRRRTSEHARRVSEKIGRLQLEVQKIQFILLKLDDGKESKGKTRVSESRRRVLLKDYLYGGRRISKSKRKKPPFCGCVQSPAQGD